MKLVFEKKKKLQEEKVWYVSSNIPRHLRYLTYHHHLCSGAW